MCTDWPSWGYSVPHLLVPAGSSFLLPPSISLPGSCVLHHAPLHSLCSLGQSEVTTWVMSAKQFTLVPCRKVAIKYAHLKCNLSKTPSTFDVETEDGETHVQLVLNRLLACVEFLSFVDILATRFTPANIEKQCRWHQINGTNTALCYSVIGLIQFFANKNIVSKNVRLIIYNKYMCIKM